MRISIKILFLLLILNSAWAKIEVEPNWDTLTTDAAYELLGAGQYDPQKISNGGDTVLHNAVKKQDLSAVKLALFIGIDPSLANKAGDTALHIAAAKGNVSIIQTLVEKSAPLDWPNKKGDTALHNAAVSGDLDITRYLVQQGAPITVANALGQTPYHKALAAKHDAVIAYFIEQGYVPSPEVDARIADGYSPLFSDDELLGKAAERGDGILVKKLLTEKDPDTFTFGLRLAVANAVQKGHVHIITLLMEHGAKADPGYLPNYNYDHYTPVQDAAKSGKTAILAILLEDPNIQLNARDEKGASALHYAVVNGDILAVKLLLERGADVNNMSHSEYKRGSIPEDYWTSYDWDALADADSALPHHFTKRQEGFVYPVISPLSLALDRHPYNSVLIELLKSYGAKEQFTDSSWDKKLRF